MDEDRVESMRVAVRERAKEKSISLFEAAGELAGETWDYEEEEIYNRWRVELLPRKQPRNPIKRLTRYAALRHPYLGLVVWTVFGLALGATALRPGYEYIFYPLAGLLLLWLISDYKIFIEIFYVFRPFEAYVDRHMVQLRKAIVEDLITLGHPLEEAERAADYHISDLRSAALHRHNRNTG
jgi:hypothetical protein